MKIDWSHPQLLVLLFFGLLSVGWPGTEDHASDANLQDLKAGPSLDRPPRLWLHPATVLPAGLTGSAAHVR